MGYYLPAKSYLRPKPRVHLKRRIFTLASTGILLIGGGIIFTSIQFGDNKNTFASAVETEVTDIPMPVPLSNTNVATMEGQQLIKDGFPVILAYFKTIKRKQMTELKWSTMIEHENAYYTIEKSYNGTTFEEIGCVDSEKSSELSSDYSFIDEQKNEGNVYYRLMQTSDNGKSTYIALEKLAGKSENNDLSLYIEQVGPQPFENFFNINYYTNRPGGISVELFDKTGKKVYKTYTDAVQGFNTCRFIDGQNLIDDEYTLRIANSSGAYVKRIKKKA